MKVIRFIPHRGKVSLLGVVVEEKIYRLPVYYRDSIEHTINEDKIKDVERSVAHFLERQAQGDDFSHRLHSLGSSKILVPVPYPRGIRDFIAFEQHIRTLRQKRGQEVPQAWYKMPLHYRGDHLTVYGPEDEIPWPRYCRERFDFELELACVIGKRGINISVEEAYEYIAGYMIMNDWSCRDIQQDEMQGGLGPSMAKPGASFGPYLVTSDELPDLSNLREEPNRGPVMRAYVNGTMWSEGKFGSIHWSFAQMIAHISQDRMIYPGEILGSGTVGGGCGAELDRWIQPGDVVELEIEGLGRLRNRVGFPKLHKKKEVQ
jgi:2-keto-4-pentenoate hydratase/2-oxohepta-3-ene-1,7-dioic acid hydratase in catechol pathway